MDGCKPQSLLLPRWKRMEGGRLRFSQLLAGRSFSRFEQCSVVPQVPPMVNPRRVPFNEPIDKPPGSHSVEKPLRFPGFWFRWRAPSRTTMPASPSWRTFLTPAAPKFDFWFPPVSLPIFCRGRFCCLFVKESHRNIYIGRGFVFRCRTFPVICFLGMPL